MDSEAYRKYLHHNDIIKRRERDKINDDKPPINQVLKDLTDLRVEEEKNSIKESISNWLNKFESKSSIDLELEETKRKFSEDINEIRRLKEEEKKSYDNDREEWLAKRTEIEEELQDIKIKLKEYSERFGCISYEGINRNYFILKKIQLLQILRLL